MGPQLEFVATGVHKDDDLTDRLAEVAVPTLAHLRPPRPDTAGGLRRGSTASCQGRKLAIFEASSHMPHLEEPEQYLAVVRDFLRRAEARSAAPGAPAGCNTAP